MDRGLELRIKGHLYEIRAVNAEVIGSEQGFPSAVSGYSKTLKSVAECAGPELVDVIGEHIKERLRAEEARPDNRSVRRKARMVLAEHEVVPDDYLNTA